MNYLFDVSGLTIGDVAEIQQAAQTRNVVGVISVANRCIPINLFALSVNELPFVLNDFLHALLEAQNPADPIEQMIRSALEQNT